MTDSSSLSSSSERLEIMWKGLSRPWVALPTSIILPCRFWARPKYSFSGSRIKILLLSAAKFDSIVLVAYDLPLPDLPMTTMLLFTRSLFLTKKSINTGFPPLLPMHTPLGSLRLLLTNGNAAATELEWIPLLTFR